MSKNLETLKVYFTNLARKQGCIYEDDYHTACYDITDSKLIGDINTWLLTANLPLKKNKTEYQKKVEELVKNPNVKNMPKKASLTNAATAHLNKAIEEMKDKDFETEFLPTWQKKDMKKKFVGQQAPQAQPALFNESDIENFVVEVKEQAKSLEDVSKALEEAAARKDWDFIKKYMESGMIPALASVQIRVAKKEEELEDRTGYAGQKLSEIIDSLRDRGQALLNEAIELNKAWYDGDWEYLQQYLGNSVMNQAIDLAGSENKTAQRIDDEKRQLEDTVMARQNEIPNWKQLLEKIRKAFDFSELRDIWEQVNSLPTVASKDPIEAHVFSVAKEEYNSAMKRKVKFDNDKVFVVDVADSPAQKAAGLEVVEKLEDGKGMIFPFEDDHVTFHMGKVKFPIDIVFLMKDPTGLRVAKVVHNAQPGSSDVWSFSETACVLELPGGTCKRDGIGIGSICSLQTRIE